MRLVLDSAETAKNFAYGQFVERASRRVGPLVAEPREQLLPGLPRYASEPPFKKPSNALGALRGREQVIQEATAERDYALGR
jgi:hypothetical protein